MGVDRALGKVEPLGDLPVAKAVGDKKWDGTLPATFVFDGAGKLRKSFRGLTTPAALEAAVKSVR